MIESTIIEGDYKHSKNTKDDSETKKGKTQEENPIGLRNVSHCFFFQNIVRLTLMLVL